MCTDFDVDFIAPSFKEAMFVEGDENGKTDCFEVSILDDDDFETNTEEFRFYITPTLISPDSTLLGEPSRISVFINDTEGMQKRLGSYYSHFLLFLYSDVGVAIDLVAYVSEADASAEICVNPGVIGRINSSLSIEFSVNDGKAGKVSMSELYSAPYVCGVFVCVLFSCRG